MKKSAFTLLELVFVIVIISIMTAVMMPKTNDEPARDAANQLKRHLQYAQHLAMVNDVFDDTNATWIKKRWGVFINTDQHYAVLHSSDGSTSSFEYAKDPSSHNDLSLTSDITDLSEKFAITKVDLKCGGTAKTVITFDNLGRPYSYTNASWASNNTISSGRLTSDCIVKLTGDGMVSTFIINKQTGYIGDVNVTE